MLLPGLHNRTQRLILYLLSFITSSTFPLSLCSKHLPVPLQLFSSDVLRVSTRFGFWKTSSQIVIVLSRACQTAAFDSKCNSWECLHWVDLCLSWSCHFITSLSCHIDSGFFFFPGQSKSGAKQASVLWGSAIKWSLIVVAPVSGLTFREQLFSG